MFVWLYIESKIINNQFLWNKCQVNNNYLIKTKYCVTDNYEQLTLNTSTKVPETPSKIQRGMKKVFFHYY